MIASPRLGTSVCLRRKKGVGASFIPSFGPPFALETLDMSRIFSMKERIVFQSQTKGCGYATVKMALIHSSKRKDFAFAPEPEISGKAPTLAELIAYAKGYGLTLSAFKVSDPAEIVQNEEYPLMLVIEENRLSHMVYLIGKKGRRFLVLDPAKGKRLLKKEELVALFTGTFLVERGYRDITERFPKKRPIRFLWKVLDLILSITPSLFLVSGLISLDYLPLWGSLPLFALALVSLFAFRYFKMVEFKAFDEKYGPFLLEENSSKRKELYAHYQSYKGLAFSAGNVLAASLTQTLIIAALFALRNYLFGIALGAAILMEVAINLIDMPRQRKSFEEIEEREYAFLNYKLSEGERKLSLLSLFSSSSTLAGFLLWKEAFHLGVSVGLGALSIAITGVADFESFVYYCLALHLLITSVDGIFKAGEESEKKKREEPFFAFHFLR